MLTAVTGLNWGDEGKGRVIDLLAQQADVVVRYQGGNNAGHTVVTGEGTFVLNLLPSGILHPGVTCILGDGMVVDLDHLTREIQDIRDRGVSVTPDHLKLSARATISMPWHRIQDGLEEDRLARKGAAFGSTRRGIAYAYSDKYRKKTLRLGDLLRLDTEPVRTRLKTMLEAKNLELGGCYYQEPMSYPALLAWCQEKAEAFEPYICDTGRYLRDALAAGKRVLLEAQLGAMRDIDYGIFPYTSSSSTISAYGPIGAGIPGCRLDHVVGVLKAYSTCVGAGPFAAEHAMSAAWMDQLREAGAEYGAATGRPAGWAPLMRWPAATAWPARTPTGSPSPSWTSSAGWTRSRSSPLPAGGAAKTGTLTPSTARRAAGRWWSFCRAGSRTWPTAAAGGPAPKRKGLRHRPGAPDRPSHPDDLGGA